MGPPDDALALILVPPQTTKASAHGVLVSSNNPDIRLKLEDDAWRCRCGCNRRLGQEDTIVSAFGWVIGRATIQSQDRNTTRLLI